MSIYIASSPAIEPVTLAEAKTHLRIDHTAEDDYITALIVVARENRESYLNRALITQTLEQRQDVFTPTVYFERGPVQAVSALTYIDANGVEQTISASDYDVDIYSTPSRITAAYGEIWPIPRSQPNAVKISYTAGYGDAATDVPQCIRQSILLIVGHLYQHREDTIEASISYLPAGADAICAHKRDYRFL